MKKIYKLFSAAALVWVCGGCTEFLTETPRSIQTPNNFYRNELEARQAVNGIYRRMSEGDVAGVGIKELPNDLVRKPKWNNGAGIGDYTFDAGNEVFSKIWTAHYSVIKDCNSAIDNITLNQNDIDNWERYVAQARGIRAYLYFDLVRWFGDVPLVIRETTSLDNLKVPRDPKFEVFTQIIRDLEYCAEHSMEKGDTRNGYQYGRFTCDAARGMLSKVYLWLGSVAQRDGAEVLGDANSNFELAMQYAKEVIDGGRYKLVDYYPDLFDYKTRDKAQEEVMFCYQGITGDGTGTWVGMYLGIEGDDKMGGAWGNVSSSDFHRMIYEQSDSVRRLWNCPRVFVQSSGKLHGWDYDIYLTTKPDDILDRADEKTHWYGWCIGKFRRYPIADLAQYNYTNFGMDEPLLRYADILLVYAEAYNEYYRNPGPYTPSTSLGLNGAGIQSAYDAVNVVRKRARMANEGIIHEDPLPRQLKTELLDKIDDLVPDWKPGFYGYIYNGTTPVWDDQSYGDDYTAFRKEILNERARELVAETTDRWCDLVRRGDLVERFKLWRRNNPFVSGSERDLTDPGLPENVKPHHMLLPIPQSERDANNNLTQNPGY